MHLVYFSLALLAVAFVIHLSIWRVRVPSKPLKALLAIFFLTGLVSAALLYLVPGLAEFAPASLAEWVYVTLFHITFTLSYVVAYTSIENVSPTLITVMSAYEAGDLGLDVNYLQEVITDESFIKPRLEDLVEQEMATLEGDRYKIAAKGLRFLKFIFFVHWLINQRTKTG